MGLFETDEAKQYAADVHRLITDGVIDHVDSAGRWLKNVGEGVWKIVDKATGALRSIDDDN